LHSARPCNGAPSAALAKVMGIAGRSTVIASSNTAAWDLFSSPTRERRLLRQGWIQSPLFDLTLFTLSPLSGLLVIIPAILSPSRIHLAIAAATYLVAIPHYVSSFSFYLGDDNLAHYRTRRLAFFVGPVLIIFAVVLLRLTRVDAPVQSGLYVWNVYHVSLQSAGILSLYRRLNHGSLSEARYARLAILAVNATLAFWHIDHFLPIYDALVRVHFPVGVIRPVFLSVALVVLALYFNSLRTRSTPMGGGELAFLISSLVLFYPYLWVHDLNVATFGMLMGHFLQYLGIVWLLNRRKYRVATGSLRQRFLSAVSTHTWLLILSLLSIGLLFRSIRVGSDWLSVPVSYTILWNSLALVHFYVDGFVWAFRNPFVRKSVGPYLTPE
jgi:hypothetical protein